MVLRLLSILALGILFLTQPVPAAAQEEPPAEGEQDPEAAAPEAPQEECSVKFIKMFAEEWKWTPNVIRVPQGTRLKIEFLSYGASRRFDLKAYKLRVKIPQDKPTTVEFVADKKGTFRWKCGRPCGNGCAKMTGKLIVE
jgi:cytochrome c oxidase subunit 2